VLLPEPVMPVTRIKSRLSVAICFSKSPVGGACDILDARDDLGNDPHDDLGEDPFATGRSSRNRARPSPA